MLSTHTPYETRPIDLLAQADPRSPGAQAAGGTDLYSDFALAGVLGRELAEPISRMQSVLREVERSKLLTGEDISRLNASINSAHLLAIQSQQIARLACGSLRQSHENLKLDALVLEFLRERTSAFRQQGIEVFQRIRPVEVIVDASLLCSLINAALDWAAGLGRKLTVTLEMKNWPEHGLLIFKTSHAIADKTSHDTPNDAPDKPRDNTVSWYLVSEISQAMGLSVQRTSSAQDTCLQIEFPRTVTRLDGMTAIEIDIGPESAYGEPRPLAGAHILFISDDARLQIEVRAICKRARLVLDCVANASQAVRFCELEFPTMVMIDQNMRGHVFNELYKDLRNTDPNFPFLEIASAANTLEMAGWTSESMSRLSKDALQTHLVAFVAMELSKVM